MYNFLIQFPFYFILGDNEITKVYKFVKRSFEMFAKSHGIQLMLEPESGARILDLSFLDDSGTFFYYFFVQLNVNYKLKKRKKKQIHHA